MTSNALSPIDFGALVAPTHVRVRGTVARTEPITSPFTGARAAAFEWHFFVNTRGTFDEGSGIAKAVLGKLAGVLEPETRLSPAGSLLHGAIVLDANGVSIAVPLGTTRFLHRAAAPALVECAWPAWLPMPEGADDGALYFTEQTLCAGDFVEVTATIAPGAPGGPFRGGEQRTDFVARAELEPIVMVELERPPIKAPPT